jgi:hypothetical protein
VARPTKEDGALIAERRADAMRLRSAGADLLTIGKALGRTSRRPRGYPATDEKQLRSAVAKDLAVGIRDRYKDQAEAASELAGVLLQRLELMWEAVADQVAEGDLRAIDTALRVIERTAKLTGLEAASRLVLTGDGDQQVAEAFRRLLDHAGQGQ